MVPYPNANTNQMRKRVRFWDRFKPAPCLADPEQKREKQQKLLGRVDRSPTNPPPETENMVARPTSDEYKRDAAKRFITKALRLANVVHPKGVSVCLPPLMKRLESTHAIDSGGGNTVLEQACMDVVDHFTRNIMHATAEFQFGYAGDHPVRSHRFPGHVVIGAASDYVTTCEDGSFPEFAMNVDTLSNGSPEIIQRVEMKRNPHRLVVPFTSSREVLSEFRISGDARVVQCMKLVVKKRSPHMHQPNQSVAVVPDLVCENAPSWFNYRKDTGLYNNRAIDKLDLIVSNLGKPGWLF